MKKQAQMTCKCGGRLSTANYKKSTVDGKAWVVPRTCKRCGTKVNDIYTWKRSYQESSPSPLCQRPGGEDSL